MVAVPTRVCDWEWRRDLLLGSPWIRYFCLPKAMDEKGFRDESQFSSKETCGLIVMPATGKGVESFSVVMLLQDLIP